MRPPVVWPDPRIVEDFPYDFDLATHTVYAGLMGSISGTYVPKEDPDSIDDVDMMAIVVPSPKWLLGLNQWEHWVKQRDELDSWCTRCVDAVLAERLLIETTQRVCAQTDDREG